MLLLVQVLEHFHCLYKIDFKDAQDASSLVFPARHTLGRLRGSSRASVRAKNSDGRGRLKRTTGTPGPGAPCPKGAGRPSI